MALERIESCKRRSDELVSFLKHGEWELEGLARVRNALFGLIQRRKSYELFLQGKRARKRPYTEWIKIKGGVWTVEIKRGTGSGCWHPHVHMLALLDAPLDMAAFRREWLEETGGEGVNVKALWINDAHTSQGAYREIFKYVCKFNTMSFEDNLRVYVVTSRMHLRGKFGCFRNVKLDDNYLADGPETDALYFKDILFVWSKGARAFYVEQERAGELNTATSEPRYRQFARADGELTVSLNYDTQRFAIKSLDYAERQSDSGNANVDETIPF